jgi:two-component system NtrC family response regulator
MNTKTPALSTPKPKLLIVEDDETLRTQMRWALAQDYEVFLAGDRPRALEVLRRERPSAVILDLGLPPKPDGVEEGLLALSEMLAEDAWLKTVVVTGHDEKAHALNAISLGAYDFFCKPVRIDELRIILRRAFYLYQLERQHRELQQRLIHEPFEGMLGTSPQMEEIYASIRKVATTHAPVLVVGESGTGKELVARAIHRQSSRGAGPFVVINCGAIPENLLESELFGHEKGAFTGAHIQRRGRIEAAQGGTLFLDEIGELTPPLQVKLLRFLQEQKIERVGGREEIAVNTRVLAASNMDLKNATAEGRFREDLYYRIGVVIISMPPLRDREGDIQLLSKALLYRYAAENNRKISGFTPQALRALKTHAWPGNVRELENRIKRAVIMAEGTRVTPEDLELTSPYAKYATRGLKEARESLERDLIRRALTRNKGNLTRTAAELSISRPTLYELMGKLGIEKQ